MNPEIPSIANPLTGAKIVSVNTENWKYLAQTVGRGDPAYVMSRSDLKDFAACPSRWRAGHRDEESTSAQLWGSLVDCLTLTPEQLLTRFAVVPESYTNEKGEVKPWNFNAGVCKEWRTQQGGREEIKGEMLQSANDARATLLMDNDIRQVLAECERQVYVTANFEDENSGLTIPVKVCIDIVPNPKSGYSKSLADLKTCKNAAKHAWKLECYSRWYHVQAAMCLDAYKSATGGDFTDFLHVIQENFHPWQVGTRYFSEEFLKEARRAYIQALRLYAKCLKEDFWPGYDLGWSLIEPEQWMVMGS